MFANSYANQQKRRVRVLPVTFGTVNCRTLDKLWILQVRPATFKYGRAVQSKTSKAPSTQQACSFFSNPFLEFCFSTSALSSIILFHKFVQAFDTLKIQCSALLWNPRYFEKGDFFEHFASTFSFCYAIFTWMWTYQTHDLTDRPLIVGTFLAAIASMGRSKQIPSLRWHRFFEQLSFHSVPPLTVSSALYLQSLLLNFRLGPFVFEAGRAAARVAAQARLGRAFQSIENRLYYEQCQAVTHPGHSRTLSLPHKPPRTRRQAKSASQCSHKAFQFVWAAWRNPRTGTLCASKVELRSSAAAAIYRSDASELTGVQSHWAVRGPLSLWWICLLGCLVIFY